jgi:hypothetical protein
MGRRLIHHIQNIILLLIRVCRCLFNVKFTVQYCSCFGRISLEVLDLHLHAVRKYEYE